MLPARLPRLVTCLLDRFRGCFTAPTFTTFCRLACGFWAQPGLHTVTGMLVGARLQQPGTTAAPTAASQRQAGRPTSSAWSCST
jgi:hypothetical protein